LASAYAGEASTPVGAKVSAQEVFATPEPAAAGISEASITSLEAALHGAAPTLREEALHAAVSAWESLESRGEPIRPFLTVIDYSLPSTARRMWVFDLASHKLLFNELVAHGRNSGENMAESFSNEDGSLMTSLGAFVTGASYIGKNGYSLRLRGIDPDINDRAESRTIVIHGAPYVSDEFAHKVGRLGRSWGCPAVRPEIARQLIDQLKDQTLLYAWHPSLIASEAPALMSVSASHPASISLGVQSHSIH
jgi:hypothetical protein